MTTVCSAASAAIMADSKKRCWNALPTGTTPYPPAPRRWSVTLTGRWINLDIVDSTNEFAKRLVRVPSPIQDCTVILARQQTNGKGRLGRVWVSPRDAGLYMTVVQRLDGPPPPDAAPYTLAAGLAVAEAIEAQCDLRVRIQPVNDIFVGDGKLAGILTESIVKRGSMTALLTGVGINVYAAVRELPSRAATATSLEECMAGSRLDEGQLRLLAIGVADRVIRYIRMAKKDHSLIRDRIARRGSTS